MIDLLGTGADFERAHKANPIHLAAAAISQLYSTSDMAGIVPKTRAVQSLTYAQTLPESHLETTTCFVESP